MSSAGLQDSWVSLANVAAVNGGTAPSGGVSSVVVGAGTPATGALTFAGTGVSQSGSTFTFSGGPSSGVASVANGGNGSGITIGGTATAPTVSATLIAGAGISLTPSATGAGITIANTGAATGAITSILATSTAVGPSAGGVVTFDSPDNSITVAGDGPTHVVQLSVAKALALDSLSVGNVPLTALSANGTSLNAQSVNQPVPPKGLTTSQLLVSFNEQTLLYEFSDVITPNVDGTWVYTYPCVFTTAPTISLSPIFGDVGALLDSNSTTACSGFVRLAANGVGQFVIRGSGVRQAPDIVVGNIIDWATPTVVVFNPTTLPANYPAQNAYTVSTATDWTFTTPAGLDSTKLTNLAIGWAGGAFLNGATSGSQYVSIRPSDAFGTDKVSVYMDLLCPTNPDAQLENFTFWNVPAVVPTNASADGIQPTLGQYNQIQTIPLPLLPDTEYVLRFKIAIENGLKTSWNSATNASAWQIGVVSLVGYSAVV